MFILKKRSWYFLTDWSCVPSSRNPFVRSSQSNSSKTTQQQTCQEKYLQRKTIHAESHNTKCIQMRNITNNTLQHSSMNSRCLYANGPYDLADTRAPCSVFFSLPWTVEFPKLLKKKGNFTLLNIHTCRSFLRYTRVSARS
jgi:hypothetical protein